MSIVFGDKLCSQIVKTSIFDIKQLLKLG